MGTTYTENYNLGMQKDHSDKFDMNVITDNMEILDSVLAEKVDKAEGYSLMSEAEHQTLAEVYGTTAASVPDDIKIPENSDLDSYEVPGVYKCISQAIANTLLHCPVSQGFRLEVKAILAYDRAYQFLYPNGNTAMLYIRSRTNAGWQEWQKVSDTTAMNTYVTNTVIPANSDLNNYAGDVLGAEDYRVFYTASNADTQTISNIPADFSSGTFTLEIMRTGTNQYLQRLTHQLYNGSAAAIYIRSKVHSSTVERWNPWYKIALTAVEAPAQTASIITSDEVM